VPTGDGIIAINLSVVEELLSVFGEITIPDYGKKVTPETLYAIAQYESERQFFPGSTQKRDFLQALTKQLFFKLETLSAGDWLKIIQILEKQLQQGNIQIHFQDKNMQQLVKRMGWSGELIWPTQKTCNNDYHFWVEANLGANKANCCIERKLHQTVHDLGNVYEITITGQISNNNIYSSPKPPKFWGGDYQNYVRLLLPQKATNISIAIGQRIIEDKDLMKMMRTEIPVQELGFWVKIPAKKSVTLNVVYQLPKAITKGPYCLFVAKQSGMPGYWYTVDYQSNDLEQQSQRYIDSNQFIQFD
jgi:hypothetical protein